MAIFDKFLDLVDRSANNNTIELQGQFSVDMVTSFARPTPVDTGRATANWKLGVNKEPQPNNDTDKTPAATKTTAAAKKAVKALGKKGTVIIKNAVQGEGESGYIIKLENGHSQQAPTGMFRKNVVRSKQIIKKSKKKIGL